MTGEIKALYDIRMQETLIQSCTCQWRLQIHQPITAIVKNDPFDLFSISIHCLLRVVEVFAYFAAYVAVATSISKRVSSTRIIHKIAHQWRDPG